MGRNLAIVEHSAAQEAVCYTWSFPGSPVQVQLKLAVVEALQEGDTGSQGLLLGKADGQTTEILDIQTLPAAEPASAEVVARAVAGVGVPAAVGYYRFTHEPVLRLSESDLRLMEAVFPARHHLFMLVQRTESGPANATFFFWDEGRMCGEFPFLEFPFDVISLATAEQHRIHALEKKLAEGEFRRRQQVMSQESRPRRLTARALLWGLVAVLAVSLIAAAVVLKGLKYWPRLVQAPANVPAAPGPLATSFGLHAERQSGDLKLTWNRESSVVLNATSGVLEIEDGGSSRKITLDPMQVRSGSILYAPSTDQVQMQLSVLTPQGTISESVLVILPKTGAPRVQALTQRVVPISPAATQPTTAVAAPPVPRPFIAPISEPKKAEAPAMSEPPPPVRPEITATLPATLTPRLTPVAPPPSAAAPKPANVPPPAAPAASASPQPSPPATKKSDQPMYYGPEVASKVVPPFPAYLKAVVPRPTMIEVKVSIDVHGRVVKAEPASPELGPPVLVAAATNAARLWRFKPARKGTEPIASELVLQFLFRPPQ